MIVDRIDLQRRMEERPTETILIAAGIGFVASGALVSRFSARVFAMAFRLAVVPMLEHRLRQALRASDDDGT